MRPYELLPLGAKKPRSHLPAASGWRWAFSRFAVVADGFDAGYRQMRGHRAGDQRKCGESSRVNACCCGSRGGCGSLILCWHAERQKLTDIWLGSFQFIICVFDCARSGKAQLAQAAFDFGISGLSMLCCVARSGQLTPAGFQPNASVQLRCATAMTSAWRWHAKDRKAREERCESGWAWAAGNRDDPRHDRR